jgi:hypothetical protein
MGVVKMFHIFTTPISLIAQQGVSLWGEFYPRQPCRYISIFDDIIHN